MRQLADLACAKFGQPDELCILLPTESTARGCSSFLASRSPSVQSRIASWPIRSVSSSSPTDPGPSRTITVWACFFRSSDFPAAKQYWQHTGEGISSRVAERCLILLGEIDADSNANGAAAEAASPATPSVGPGQEGATRFFVNGNGNGPVNGGRYASSKSRYQVAKAGATTPPVAAGIEVARPAVSSKLRYSTSKVRTTHGGGDSGDATPSSSSEADSLANSIEQLPMPSSSSRRLSQDAATASSSSPLPTPATPLLATTNGTVLAEQDEDVLARYVEERYGRNLDLSLAPLAKLAMRRRIAGVLREGPGEAIPVQDMTGARREESTRGVTGLTEDDVWLYPCGMNAIFHAHQVAMEAWKRQGKEVGKSVCFGCVAGDRRFPVERLV